jgi:hypothetical protein
MSRVKIVDSVYRLKNDYELRVPNADTINLKGGQEFHIVADVLYMGGYPLPAGLQDFMINWITSNPALFIGDNRSW